MKQWSRISSDDGYDTLSPSFTEKHVSHCMPTATKSGACVAGGCQLTAWQRAKVSISSAQRYTNGHQHTACVSFACLLHVTTKPLETYKAEWQCQLWRLGSCCFIVLTCSYRSCCQCLVQCLVGSRGLGGDQEGWTWNPNGTHQTCILLRYALPRGCSESEYIVCRCM